MKRLFAYDVSGNQELFISQLNKEGFRVLGKDIASKKEHVCLNMGYFNDGYLVIASPLRMNQTELDERSRLIRIADNFGD